MTNLQLKVFQLFCLSDARRAAGLGLVVVSQAFGLASAYSADINTSAPEAGRALPPASALPRDASDLFSAHALQGKARRCASAYASLGNALAGGAQFTVQTQTHKTDPENHGILGVVGMSYQSSADVGYTGPAAGLVMTVPNGSMCEGVMVRVVPFTQQCTAAAALLPAGSKNLPALSGVAMFSLPGGSQALLLPSSNGCVVISLLRAGG